MKISVTEFKAKCLAIFERIRETGESVTVTKHGIPVAEVVPPYPGKARSPQDELKGSVRVLGDIVRPVLPPSSWEAERSTRRARRRR
jgi:prevent-host-death family protein